MVHPGRSIPAEVAREGSLSCPACGSHKVFVTDSRSTDNGRTVRRRRRCADCEHRWTTAEVPIEAFQGLRGLESLIGRVNEVLVASQDAADKISDLKDDVEAAAGYSEDDERR